MQAVAEGRAWTAAAGGEVSEPKDPIRLYRRTPDVTPLTNLLARDAELHPERYALPPGYVPPPPSCDAVYEFGEPADGGEDARCERAPGHRGMHRGTIREATVLWPQECWHGEEE